MNIFFLHFNTKKCAKYHVDRHVVKMILESFQILCTVICLKEPSLTPDDETSRAIVPCKPTHVKHPCVLWAKRSLENWLWLRKLTKELCREYTFRYGKHHKYEDKLYTLPVPELPEVGFTPPAQAMPVIYKVKDDPISAYRKYYKEGKKHLHYWTKRHAWKNREIPDWIL
jgi:hypothetical protein